METLPEEALSQLGRYRVEERLGRGSMGVVYRVYDHQRDARLALKCLTRVEPSTILQFKNEFRALADLTHPHLITLYDLVAMEDTWFFTMELLSGLDLVTHIRRAGGSLLIQSEDESNAGGSISEDFFGDTDQPTTDGSFGNRTFTKRERPALTKPEQFQCMRHSLTQVVDGLSALHLSGRMHRDIKPSNILVDQGARVVVLDFGISLGRVSSSTQSSRIRLAGTPAYMAPEQFRGVEITPACDFYALGVIMYEALVGRLPFSGTARELMKFKSDRSVCHPTEANPNTPDDLASLCWDLLHPDAQQRPTQESVAARLGLGSKSQMSQGNVTSGKDQTLNLGREAELSKLLACFERSKQSQLEVAMLIGNAGVGKSSLMRQFAQEVESHNKAIVLYGRCFERESLSYKALDSLMDSLVMHLQELSHAELEQLLPEQIAELGRLFPVMRELELVRASGIQAGFEELEPQELRRRAFGALRSLLINLSEQQPSLLCIDDVQWGDVDSAVLINELCRQPRPTGLMFLLTYRKEDIGHSPFLQQLIELGLETTQIEVSPLGPAQAQQVAARLLAQGGCHDNNLSEIIANEARGIPLFITELSHYVTSHKLDENTFDLIPLDQMIRNRVAALTPWAREFLEILAIAGKPVAQIILRRASLEKGSQAKAIEDLRSLRLISIQGSDDEDLVECYHNRIQEIVVDSLSAERTNQIHGRLATVLKKQAEATQRRSFDIHRLQEKPKKLAAMPCRPPRRPLLVWPLRALCTCINRQSNWPSSNLQSVRPSMENWAMRWPIRDTA